MSNESGGASFKLQSRQQSNHHFSIENLKHHGYGQEANHNIGQLGPTYNPQGYYGNSINSQNSYVQHETASTIAVADNNYHNSVLQKMINVQSGIEEEEEEPQVDKQVRHCFRSIIWSNHKFYTNAQVAETRYDDHPRFDTSVIGIVMNYTKKKHYDLVGRVKFWRRYSTIGQAELGTKRSNVSRSIKQLIMKGVC